MSDSDESIINTNNTNLESIPKIVFIVPYRDREIQKNFFIRHMNYILEDIPKDDYKIFFSEQCDNRDFNRGAMKNIGFLAIKNKYPNHYKNITFVFNDVDTMPFNKNLFNYQTTENNVKHFYGYNYTLGGIISIIGSDFEKILGFPNLWTWGYEDNSLQYRVIKNNINIDRSNHYKILCKEIIQLTDDFHKIVNRNEFERYMENKEDGIHTIYSLDYNIDEINQTIYVKTFEIPYTNNKSTNSLFNIASNTNIPFKYTKNKKNTMSMIFK
jgi:hypothetical protein